MHPFFHGLLFGLLFLLIIGPAFFTLIQTSIQKGLRPALFFVIGISVSDVCYVVLALLGVASLFDNYFFKLWIGVIGAALLLILGVFTWIKPPQLKKVDHKESKYLIKYFIKGLFINGLNPFLILFWISLVSFVSVQYDYGIIEQRYFFVGLLMTVLTSDVIKVLVITKNRRLIQPNFIKWMNKVVATILIIFGIRIIYYLYANYY